MHLSFHGPSQHLRSAALLGLVGTCLAVSAAPAAAHDRLVSTTPTAGATVATAPSTIGLSFSAKVMPVGTQVVVKDPSGTNRVTSSTVSGSRVTTKLRPGGAAGKYQVAWRVVSQDGHPISGTYSFTTKQAATPKAATTARPTSPRPTSSASTAVAAPVVSPSTTAATPATSAPTTAADAQAAKDSSPSWRPWALSLPIVALAAIAVTMLRRGRKR